MPEPLERITAMVFSEEDNVMSVILTPVVLNAQAEQEIGSLAGRFNQAVDFLPLYPVDLCESIEEILQRIKDKHPGETDDCDPPYNEGEERYSEEKALYQQHE